VISRTNPDRYLSAFGEERVEEIACERAEQIDEEVSVVRHHAARVCALAAFGGSVGLVLTGALAIAVAVGVLDGPPLGKFWKPLVSNVVWLSGFGKLGKYVDNPGVYA